MITGNREIASRSCGDCTLCCRLPEIDALEKPADEWCRHCNGHGCTIYADRPQLCRDFLCLWMTDDSVSDDWQPTKSHMLVYEQGPQITVLVDPHHSDIWRQEPYSSDLRLLAAKAATLSGYLILFCGENVMKIEA